MKGPCETSKSASGDDLIDLTGPGEVSLNSENTHPNRNGNNQNSMNASFVAEKLQASSGASNVMISRERESGREQSLVIRMYPVWGVLPRMRPYPVLAEMLTNLTPPLMTRIVLT